MILRARTRRRGLLAAVLTVALLAGVAAPAAGIEPDIPVDPGFTERSSRDAGVSGGRELPDISANGQFLVFVARGMDAQGVWMVDRVTGTTQRLTTGNHFNPSVSDTGRYVAYVVYGGNRQVRLLDRATGSDTLVSVADDETPASGLSDFPSVDATGRFIAFQSTDRDLDPRVQDPAAGGGPTRVYVRDRVLGETHMVSVTDDGFKARGNAIKPAITHDGRYVAFASDATNLVEGGAGEEEDEEALTQQVYRHDRATGTTELASVGTGGEPGDGTSAGEFGPSISGDGNRVAFESESSNLVAGDTNQDRDAFVRDMAAGTTVRVSVDENGSQIDLDNEGIIPDPSTTTTTAEDPTAPVEDEVVPRVGAGPAISGNGLVVAFHTEADIEDEDVNEVVDVYMYDLGADELADRVSVPSNGGTDATGTRIDGHTGEEVAQINGYDATIGWSGLHVSFVSNGDLANDRPLSEEDEEELSTEPATFTRTRFQNEPAPPPPFSDVNVSSPFYDEIAWSADQGLLRGYADGTFQPLNPLTRQATAAVLYRLAGEPSGPFPDPGFSDVTPSHPFYTEISWAADAGIVQGYADGTFKSTQPVSRQALSAFLHRFAEAGDGPFPDPQFPDVTASHRFFDEIAWAWANAITYGYNDGTFRGSTAITRQAVVAFFARFVLASAAS
ncbi:MAG: S-layer homology domain-containing protein [Deltaproteobacteria bacterium]|nr:S-layer homology domain-containing protein [Deltaproteobacteria bacterium]